MNAFSSCLAIELQGYELITPYLRRTFEEFIYVNTSKRRDLYLLIQKNAGDLIVKHKGEIYFVDLKTETTNRHGNFFLETWSNRSRRTPGWLEREHGVQADYLFYIFLEQRRLFTFNLDTLRRWAYDERNLERFPLKRQGKYEQMNDTWGVCVPIDVLLAEARGKRIELGGSS